MIQSTDIQNTFCMNHLSRDCKYVFIITHSDYCDGTKPIFVTTNSNATPNPSNMQRDRAVGILHIYGHHVLFQELLSFIAIHGQDMLFRDYNTIPLTIILKKTDINVSKVSHGVARISPSMRCEDVCALPCTAHPSMFYS